MQSSIKDINNNKLSGDLDVETNYLKSSNQNFGDELHLKTVFQKRAGGPVSTTHENNINHTGSGDVVREAVIEEQRVETSHIE